MAWNLAVAISPDMLLEPGASWKTRVSCPCEPLFASEGGFCPMECSAEIKVIGALK